MQKRHIVLWYLVLLSVITYLDRLCIAVAGPRMQGDLGIPPERWGWVLGVFLLSYSAFEFPTGAWGDRAGHRKILTRIVVWWSCFTVLTGLVSSFPLLLLTRFLFGMGEAGAYPNASGVIARWFPATERGRAQGVVWSASRVGGALAPLIVVPVQTVWGWRASFWLFGLVGIVWAVAWYGWYRDPAHPAGDGHSHAGVPWFAILRSRQLWLVMAMYWCYVWGAWFYLSWFPTYLVKGRGFSESEMGVYSAIPFVLGAIGNIAGGLVSDSLSRKHGPRTGRRVVGAVSLAVSALLLLATALTTGKLVGIVLLALGFGVMDCMLPAAWALCLDIGKERAGAVTGAMNTAGQFGGFICSVLFGYIVRATGSYDAPIVLIAAMVMLSAFLFTRIDASKPILAAQKSQAG